jgi:hypothetical protein
MITSARIKARAMVLISNSQPARKFALPHPTVTPDTGA